MKNLVCRTLMLFGFVLVLGSFAFAQDPGVMVNLPSWGTSLLSFAAALALITQFVKVRLKNRLEHVPNGVIQGITVLFGIGVSAAIQQQGLLVDPLFASLPNPLGWILYGALAGVGAAGGYDLLTALLGMIGGKALTVDGAGLPQNPEDLLEIVKSSDLALDVRKRAVDTLKNLNPLAGAAAEIALNQLATRPLSVEEGRTERDKEAERRAAQNPKVVQGG